MRSFLYLVLIFILFLNCGKDVDVQTLEIEPLTDVLTLELSFGDEKTITKEEFLLVRPWAIAVNNEGDIYMSDEGRIKVFDNNGKEKKIFGRVGQGPGEFSRNHAPYLGPAGYLMVVNGGVGSGPSHFFSHSSLSDSYNLFAPDYVFIKKERFYNSFRVEEYLTTINLNVDNFYNISQIIVINTTEKVYEIAIKDKLTGPDITNYAVILYEDADKVIPLFQTILINDPTGGSTGYPLGELHWELLPDRRVIYIDANEDTYDEQAGSFYTIHVLSLDERVDTRITRQFIPVEYPESMTTVGEIRYPAVYTNEDKKQADEFRKQRAETFRDKKYYPSIERMKIDGNYAFMFTHNKNDDEEIITDIFDLEVGKYITSVYFPFIPADIKNGYAYRRGKSEEGFFIVEKYKIDPAVYGK